MFLSVVVCTYNREKYIQNLLYSLYVQNIDKTNFEIIFIDNNSTDNTQIICKEFEETHRDINFKYYQEHSQGLSNACNRGIKEASGNIIIFIDDDAVADKSFLKEIQSFFTIHKDILAGGGKILPRYETARPKWMSKYIEPIVSVINLGNKIIPFPENKFPIGANMFFRKTVFSQIGIFNPELGRNAKKLIGGEEKDLFKRIRDIDEKIYYVPDAMIYHCIPEERLKTEHIKKQAYGIGYSEKIRAKSCGKLELMKSYVKEILKQAATIALSVIYILQIRFSKAKMIFIFRYYVTKGLFWGKRI